MVKARTADGWGGVKAATGRDRWRGRPLLLNAKEALPAGGALTISCANQGLLAVGGLPLGKYPQIKVRESGTAFIVCLPAVS